MIGDYAQYQIAFKTMNVVWPAAPEDAIKVHRARGDKLIAERVPDARSRIEALKLTAKMGEVIFMGVLAEDPTACYAAILFKGKSEFDTETTQILLFAITMVKGKLLYYNLFSPYVSGDTVMGMLALHKKNVAALLEANGN